MTNARRRRGAETERRFAEHLAEHGWPHAQPSRGHGTDITGTPGIGWELKARRGFTPLQWLRQVHAHQVGLPIAVLRPDGLGPAHIDEWAALMRVSDLIELLHAAGYGDKNATEAPHSDV
jgi:hypothetical protein